MNQKQCALSCASYIIFNLNEQKSVGINIAPPKITFSMMKRDNKIGCLTAIYDTQLLGQKILYAHFAQTAGLGTLPADSERLQGVLFLPQPAAGCVLPPQAFHIQQQDITC